MYLYKPCEYVIRENGIPKYRFFDLNEWYESHEDALKVLKQRYFEIADNEDEIDILSFTKREMP